MCNNGNCGDICRCNLLQPAIDWTKPVQTSENPPRPVRVLCTDYKCNTHPCAVVFVVHAGISDQLMFSELTGNVPAYRWKLVNVPKPKKSTEIIYLQTHTKIHVATRKQLDSSPFLRSFPIIKTEIVEYE